MKARAKFVISIDVETPQTPLRRGLVDQCLMCARDHFGKECAVGLISAILKEFDIRGTFFVAVDERFRFDEEVVRSVVDSLAHQGHEVGLHSHPIWRKEAGGREHLWQYDRAAQYDMVADNREWIEKTIGQPVISHRAGAYSINDDSLSALEEAGILVDSSVYHRHPNCKLTELMNIPRQFGGVFELPVSGFFMWRAYRHRSGLPVIRRVFQKIDISQVAPGIIVNAARRLAEQGSEYVNLFLHSYSPMTFRDNWTRYDLNVDVVGGLTSILKVITADDRFEIVCMREIVAEKQNSPEFWRKKDVRVELLFGKCL